MRFKLAIRNISRHQLRSLLSVCMIAGAIIAIILFRGFSDYSMESLRKTAAENQYGHMQVALEKYWYPGKESRKDRMLDLEILKNITTTFPEIDQIAGRLSSFGLISNGDTSAGAKIIGIDIDKEPNFKKSVRILKGNFLTNSDAKEILIGSILAKQMNVTPGDSVTVLSNTIDGIMNAMDLTVSGIYTAGLDEIDSQITFLPLAINQTLLDTKNVDIAVLHFNKLDHAIAKQPEIDNNVKKINPNFLARHWKDLAVLYRQVEQFYSVQNKLVEGILLALMFLGILNTVSMTVVERTGEIGTLRALGESQKDIIKQFVLESFIVSMVGIAGGIFGSLIIIKIVEASHIMTEMPGASVPFQIKVNFLYSAVSYACFLSTATTIIATIIPAFRASKMDVVEALRKNI